MDNDALKEFEYCIIGPNHVLRSYRDSERIWSKNSLFPFILRVDNNRSKGVAYMEATLLNDVMVLMKIHTQQILSAEARGELYKLFSRACLRLSNAKLPIAVKEDLKNEPRLKDILKYDGFASIDDVLWVHQPYQYILEDKKAHNMEEVYNQPFFIPWNFVPLEFDAYEPLLKVDPDEHHNTKLLDLGCGFGKNSIFLESQGFNVFGLDISRTAITRCRTLVNHPERFITGSATQLPWNSGTFNYIIDVGCIHCLSDDERPLAIKEISRVLTRTGVFYSRIFKPRDAKWLSAQPFETSRFGITKREVLSLFNNDFNIQFWKNNKDVHYIRCEKK